MKQVHNFWQLYTIGMESNITVKKGKSYICIEDWKKLGTSFTKGKIYVCHKDRCMYDDFGAEKASVGKLFRLATREEIKMFDNIMFTLNLHIEQPRELG